ISGPLTIDLSKRIIPLVGVNECGKTTILQAILCFDQSNDQIGNSSHLEKTINLYETQKSEESTISALIECPIVKFKEIVEDNIALKDNYNESVYTPEEISIAQEVAKNFHGQVNITRHLKKSGNYYSSDLFPYNENILDIERDICENIVALCPYILYNDDFNDRPVSEVNLIPSGNSIPGNSEWRSIFERVFKDAGIDSSWDNIFNEDPELQDSILSDVQSYLTRQLTNEWKKFSPEKASLTIKLNLSNQQNEGRKLHIKIVERKGDKDRHFLITSRSKGFIWYYNFIMKILFNPKQTGAKKSTIFLLDEPGSYLHAKAQESLCQKLGKISQNEGIIIYCTHAPQLLNPEVIPFNNIQIVKKTSKGHIQIAPISNEHGNAKTTTVMQAVYDALLIPEYQVIKNDERIICVEGIHDKYCLELFCEIPENVRILPGRNANSILNNIQYLIAYQIPYVAIWDNDKEGRKWYKEALNVFGPIESRNFLLLPEADNKNDKRRMEEMISTEDYIYLKKYLDLEETINYSGILFALKQLSQKERKKILAGISQTTKLTFEHFFKKVLRIFQGK
uniref:AAA family ATPase n=1 Tax=Akkermansia sp. TaxID=1872421 RepID=UPI003AF8BEC0